MAVKIHVDREKCIGCGACAAICPEYFDMDSSGKSRPKKQGAKEAGCAAEAASNCPVQCITISKK